MEVAKILLDFFMSKKQPTQTSMRVTSTPAKQVAQLHETESPVVSGISVVSTDSEPTLSADEGPKESQMKTSTGRQIGQKCSSSFVDPFNVSIDVTLNPDINDYRFSSVSEMGDGRNDSPVHSAQYCSFTLMEESTKKILTLQTLDKRTTELKSTNMEKVGFTRAVQEIRGKGLHIQEVVTDAHLGIGAVMKSTYPDIKHSHDIWHAAKNLGKKIMKTIWRSLLHHITNQHKWVLSHGTGINECLHEPLDPEEERNKPWLSPSEDKKALEKLAAVMLDTRFLRKVHYYLNFRSTSELEVFHQLILMYCAKRFAYSPPVYKIRNRLAAIDHNYHLDRPLKRNKDGEIRYHRCFVKKSKRWSVFPEKVKKDYGYVNDLKRRALVLRLEDRIGMKGKELDQDDPRRIAAHIAPVEPLSTKELMQEKKSRFETN